MSCKCTKALNREKGETNERACRYIMNLTSAIQERIQKGEED